METKKVRATARKQVGRVRLSTTMRKQVGRVRVRTIMRKSRWGSLRHLRTSSAITTLA